MAKRKEPPKVEAKKAQPRKRKREGVAVRLDLSPEEHARLKKCADSFSLSMASFARMATMRLVTAWEKGEFK